MLDKPYPLLPKNPTKEQIKELESYRVDELMAKNIMLMYMEDDMIRFSEDCKTTK